MMIKAGVVLLVWFTTLGALVLGEKRGHATGFPVVDLSNLAQNILGVLNSAKQITNQITQISNQMSQIQNQLKELQTFEHGSSFGSIQNQMMDQMQGLAKLMSQLTVIRYKGESILNEFQGLFPIGSLGANKSLSNYRETYARWNDELLNASITAMDAQAVLSKMTTRNLEVTQLLDQSSGADGMVRQLQVVNEMLALSTGHLLDLSSALITTGRLTSTMTAVSASQDRVAFEAALKARQNYTSRGKTVPVLQELPRIP